MLDPALDTLLLPFADGTLAWPEAGQILFLRARAGAALMAAPRERLLCRQSYLPFAQALSIAKLRVDHGAEIPAGPFPLTLLLPPRQRDEARGLLAEAIAHTAPGGLVVAALPNNEGARSVEEDLAGLAGTVESRSKNKCRVFWARIDPAHIDRPRLLEWRALTEPRRIADSRFLSRPGLFAWDRIDAGSALLAQHLPADLAGHGADLGAGYGYLAAEILARCAKVSALDLYEAEREALRLAERNLQPLAQGRPLEFFWHDVATGLRRDYDFIVTNPPFHVLRAERTDLGQAFISTAAKHLKPGGRFLLVANQHLPYERGLRELFAAHRVLASADGYKVIEAVKAS
ncbi:class I SAM-dependent methyltransferase [Dongia sp.]|uniref:class I SAM-dependent methyltransferase n=1 Tax=Dongia sp. TaxID=1977262 RepID=UPI0035B22C21